MSGVNKAILIGHLGKDPEIRSGADGKKIASFSMATGKAWTDKATGERKESTQWHRVVIFNDALAGIAEQYLKKGSKLYVEGEICKRKWTDQGGADRYVTEIVLSGFGAKLVLLDRAERVPPAEEAAYGAQTGAPASAKQKMDDGIPF